MNEENHVSILIMEQMRGMRAKYPLLAAYPQMTETDPYILSVEIIKMKAQVSTSYTYT